MKEKVGAGHTDWTEFLQAVCDVDVAHIKEGVSVWKKKQEDQEAIKKRIQQLEKLTASPMAALRQQITTFGLGSNPSSSTQQPGHSNHNKPFRRYDRWTG